MAQKRIPIPRPKATSRSPKQPRESDRIPFTKKDLNQLSELWRGLTALDHFAQLAGEDTGMRSVAYLADVLNGKMGDFYCALQDRFLPEDGELADSESGGAR